MDVKLIDILVRELPKRGGWPEGADHIATNGYWRVFAYWDGSSLKGIDLNISSDAEGYVTREQYEAALAASKPEWDGDGLPPVGTEAEVSVDGGRTWCLYKATSEHNGMRLVEIGDFTEEFQSNNWMFRPIRSEADKKRENLAKALHIAAGAAPIEVVGIGPLYLELADKILAGEVAGIRID
ncbi:hypothetical protein A3466_07955 [Enterobacter genomosp. S]|uniref:Uncharacterized protein n=1 Tax=Enterobacter genomosp. S TaxID=2364151 RepID=A0ABR5YJC9_9ENTR|nr:hypothetical protein A3466_07955 [Enterobacter genomosp. S]